MGIFSICNEPGKKKKKKKLLFINMLSFSLSTLNINEMARSVFWPYTGFLEGAVAIHVNPILFIAASTTFSRYYFLLTGVILLLFSTDNDWSDSTSVAEVLTIITTHA